MKILITTHGNFANGIAESAEMIAGKMEFIHTISLTNEGIDTYQKALTAFLDTNQETDILILCDLKGGTPFNECYAYYLGKPKHIRVIAGLNLPMLLEVALQIPAALSLDAYAELAYKTGKQEIHIAQEEHDEDFIF